MRKNLQLVIAGLLALSLCATLAWAGGIKAGAQAPTFTLENMEGDDVTVEFGKGRAALVSLWVSTCKICQEEFPFLEEVKAKYGNKMDVYMINCDMLGARGVLKAMKRMGKKVDEITFPVLLDPGLQVARDKFGYSTYPAMIFVNKEGKVDKTVEGFDEDLKQLAMITAERLSK